MRDDNSEWQQVMEERERMTEEAYLRARNGVASQEDWSWLASELGLSYLSKERDNVYI